jgi:hypothetical protein
MKDNKAVSNVGSIQPSRRRENARGSMEDPKRKCAHIRRISRRDNMNSLETI